MADNRKHGADIARDLLIRCGRYIPDPTLDGDARTDRIEDFLVALSEELESLLPILLRALAAEADVGSATSPDGTPGSGEE